MSRNAQRAVCSLEACVTLRLWLQEIQHAHAVDSLSQVAGGVVIIVTLKLPMRNSRALEIRRTSHTSGQVYSS